MGKLRDSDPFIFLLKKIMKNKIKNSKTLVIIGLVAVAALGYFFVIKPKYNQAPAINASANHAAEVTVVIVQKQEVQIVQELPARVNAAKISDVRPQIEGVIKKIKFSEGSFVKEGEQLYQIDPTIYQAAAQSADRNLKTLRAKRDRYQILLEQDAVSKQEFDDIEAAFAQAESDAKKAKTNFNYTKVLAPISGYIGKSNLTEGALVTANQAEVLTTIAQLDPIYVDMTQPTKEALQLGDQKGILVSVASDDSGEVSEGKLKFSEIFADESTDSIRLRALFENKNKKLIPGMFVTAKMHLKPIKALLVPQRATTRTPKGDLMVWVVQGEVAKARVIKAEKISGDSWVVAEGLEDGEVVIVEGYQKIADGMKVNAVAFSAGEKK